MWIKSLAQGHLLLVGIEPGTSRSRVLCFTTAPQRSLVLEKKIVKCFSPYMGMAAILFNDAGRFSQTDNTPSTEGPVFREEDF